MRATFKHEHSLIPKPRSGDSAARLNYIVQWPLYHLLTFLKDQITPFPSKCNLSHWIEDLTTEDDTESKLKRSIRTKRAVRKPEYVYTDDISEEENIPDSSGDSKSDTIGNGEDDDQNDVNYGKEKDIKPVIISTTGIIRQARMTDAKKFRKNVLDIEEKKLNC